MKQSYFTSPGFTFRQQPFGTPTALFLLFFLLNFSFGFGQDPENTTPHYIHDNDEDIGSATIADTDEIIIAIATDSDGFIYTLSFGSGVDKLNPNGTINEANFISENDLDAPMDIEINSNGEIHITDYFASGECGDNGKIKVFNRDGNLLPDRTILTEFYRPLGLAINSDDQIYVAEYNPEDSGCESEEMSRINIYAQDGSVINTITNVHAPYRLAVDSENFIYVSHDNNGNSEVAVFNDNFIKQSPLTVVESPGSIEIDKYGFIHVVDYVGRLDFGHFLNFEDLSDFQLIGIAFGVLTGINEKDFIIQIFDRNRNHRDEFRDENVEFPVDIVSSNNICEKNFYINNSSIRIIGFSDAEFNFDIEVYNRNPSYDTENPLAVCESGLEFTLENGEVTITAEEIDGGSTDNCEIESLELSQYTFENEGNFPVTLTVTDTNGNTHSCTTTIKIVADENIAPEANDDEYQTDQDETLTRAAPGVLENDTDTESDALTAEIVDQPNNGTVTLNPDGSFNYEPDAGYFGTDTFTYIANDGEEDSSPATVTITVNEVVPTNRPPNALAESYTINQGEVLNISAPGVLENDSDPDGDNLTADLRRPAANGDFNFASNGSFTYEPDPGYTGVDDFIYVAYDGEDFSGEVRVTITVNQVNSAPIAEDDTYEVDQDEILNIPAPGVLGNDEDEDEDNLNANLEEGAQNGTVTLNSDGSFEYEPEDAFSGQDSFTYRANDGELDSNIATVTITVNATDPSAPQFEDCPTLIQRNINTVECEALVIFDEPTASDDSGELTVNLVSELGSGDLFPVGTTRVTYEATGQNGETITCSFVVEIIDENLPEIVLCPENIEVEIASGENAIPVTYPNPEFTDRCGIVDIQRTGPASGEDFPLGRTVVTYTAFDENDNEISCSFEVLVERENESAEFEYRCIEEAEIPNITLDEDCELNIPSYTFFVQAQNFNPAMTQTYEKLTEDTYLITVEIREFGSDEFVGECEFLVNVVDLIPPGISCPNDQIESFDPDTGFEVPNYENMAGISDNCGEVSFRQEPAAGEIIYNNTTVNLFVEDEGGLEASCSFELELTEADVLNISCLIDKNVNPDDNCSFWLPDYTSNADVNFPGADITQTPPVGTILTESTQIKLTASLNGETDECYFMVNLVDDQDPVANCVSGYVVNLDNNGTASITPEDLDNNSTDNCGIVSMALSQVDFTTADIGNVPVTLTVRDDAGNIDSCETTVEVRGEVSGEFECRENIEVFLDENGEANLNIQELYTGDASGLNLEASRLNFTCEDLGAAFIQLDYSGDETGSCTINVYVRDELPPEINTNLVELTLDNEGFAYLEESDISAEDNCSEELIYRFSKSVFTCKEVGMNSVNVEVEDINGNKNDKNIHVRISGEGCDLPEPGENEYLFLYPNPNNGIFTIATPEGMFIEQVRVFDSRGRYIMQQDYNANARFYRMTIQGVEESVYTLQIFTNEGVIVKRAIIKR